jgi:hypothetical protein
MHNTTTHDYFHLLMPTREMHPRIYMGERVIFDKNQAPESDDDVVIALVGGGIKVRRLIEIAEEHFVVGTYEPESTERISRASVLNMWPVAWREDPDRYKMFQDAECKGEPGRA